MRDVAIIIHCIYLFCPVFGQMCVFIIIWNNVKGARRRISDTLINIIYS